MPEPARTVLLVDDDERFASTLARALTRRGWVTTIALDAESARAVATTGAVPDAAIVDLRIGETSGLDLVPTLRALGPDMRIVVLTGYASIATAVRAVQLGANDYLAKPITASAVVSALQRSEPSLPPSTTPAPAAPMSPRRLEWEHIQRVLAEHQGNVSATARALKMHRRTLQRKLAKRPSSE
jgi:two-component system response regulator RegA